MYALPSRYRFLTLLVALVLLLLGSPVVARYAREADSIVARVVITGLFLIVLLSAVYAIRTRRQSLFIAGGLGGATFLLQALSFWNPAYVVMVLEHALAVAFVGYTVILVLGHLFAVRRVTIDTIAASVCTYLLLGVLWALVFSLMELTTPGSFNLSTAVTARHLRFGGAESATALYFSFVTLSTLGYGDITPATPGARMLTAAEAVVGQMYLAVLVARLVGLHIVHETERRTDSST